MICIEECQIKDIPKNLCYDGYQIDRDNNAQTPLMLWIKYRQTENIPKKLYYDDY